MEVVRGLIIYLGMDVHKDSITIAVIAHAWKAKQRLHQRYAHLSARNFPGLLRRRGAGAGVVSVGSNGRRTPAQRECGLTSPMT